jgi:LEA14-like dessication related protein
LKIQTFRANYLNFFLLKVKSAYKKWWLRLHPPYASADAKLRKFFDKKTKKVFFLFNIMFSNFVNMNIKALIGVGVGAAILLYLVGRKKLSGSATFSFEKFKVEMKKKAIIITLGVNNPTSQSLTINSIVGNLLLSGKTVASIETFNKTNVIPNAKTLIDLTVKPSLAGLAQTVLAMAKKTQKAADLKLKFVGNGNVDGIAIPINTQLG